MPGQRGSLNTDSCEQMREVIMRGLHYLVAEFISPKKFTLSVL